MADERRAAAVRRDAALLVPADPEDRLVLPAPDDLLARAVPRDALLALPRDALLALPRDELALLPELLALLRDVLALAALALPVLALPLDVLRFVRFRVLLVVAIRSPFPGLIKRYPVVPDR